MKTKTLLISCLVIFASSFIQAQSPVVKTLITQNVGGFYLPCTGDYLFGDVTLEVSVMKNNAVWKLRRATVLGYLDAAGTEPSGNVYESSQTFPGGWFLENTAHFRLDGKLVAVFKFMLISPINANDEIVHDKFTFNFICL